MFSLCALSCYMKCNRSFCDSTSKQQVCVFVCVGRVFGHISYRSDWELVKVDFRQSFPRQCSESDYESWQLMDLQVIHTEHTHHTHLCVYSPKCWIHPSTRRGRRASWVRSEASGSGRTRPSASKGKATRRPWATSRASALRETSPGEHTSRVHGQKFKYIQVPMLEFFVYLNTLHILIISRRLRYLTSTQFQCFWLFSLIPLV